MAKRTSALENNDLKVKQNFFECPVTIERIKAFWEKKNVQVRSI